MRNIAEFPVTKDEILDYLDNLNRDLSLRDRGGYEIIADTSIGGIDGVILFELRALVEKHYGSQTILRSSCNN